VMATETEKVQNLAQETEKVTKEPETVAEEPEKVARKLWPGCRPCAGKGKGKKGKQLEQLAAPLEESNKVMATETEKVQNLAQEPEKVTKEPETVAEEPEKVARKLRPGCRPCAGPGCKYQVTWHGTHCCVACFHGKGHGKRCEQLEQLAAPQEVLMSFPVMLEDGRELRMEWQSGDDLEQVATGFVQQHGIPEEMAPQIVESARQLDKVALAGAFGP